MKWTNSETFSQKKTRVEAAIQRALDKGHTVSLVGESAGASMMLNVRADNPQIYRCVSLCGITTSKTPIAASILAKKPAFAESMVNIDTARRKIIDEGKNDVRVITARRDPSVPVAINQINGAPSAKVFSVGHLTTIFLCLTVYSFVVVRTITRA